LRYHQQLKGIIARDLEVMVDACQSGNGLFAPLDFLNSLLKIDWLTECPTCRQCCCVPDHPISIF
jgi:hypothetical protein